MQLAFATYICLYWFKKNYIPFYILCLFRFLEKPSAFGSKTSDARAPPGREKVSWRRRGKGQEGAVAGQRPPPRITLTIIPPIRRLRRSPTSATSVNNRSQVNGI